MYSKSATYESLKHLGLSHSQSRLYIELLKIGASTVTQIAHQLNTSRQAVYLLLPELLDRGLLKEVHPSKRALYQPLPPSQLFSLLDEAKAGLENIVPELTNLQAPSAEVPLVTIYDSPLSMREWYRQYLEKSEMGEEFLLYSSGNLENWYRLDPAFYDNYMERQLERKTEFLCLVSNTKRTQQHKKEIG